MSPFLELSIKNIVVNKYLVEQAKFLYLRLKQAQSEVSLYSFRLSQSEVEATLALDKFSNSLEVFLQDFSRNA